MKPPLDAKVIRPSPYNDSQVTKRPGYLARRFAEIRRRQKEKDETDHQERLNKIARIR